MLMRALLLLTAVSATSSFAVAGTSSDHDLVKACKEVGVDFDEKKYFEAFEALTLQMLEPQFVEKLSKFPEVVLANPIVMDETGVITLTQILQDHSPQSLMVIAKSSPYQMRKHLVGSVDWYYEAKKQYEQSQTVGGQGVEVLKTVLRIPMTLMQSPPRDRANDLFHAKWRLTNNCSNKFYKELAFTKQKMRMSPKDPEQFQWAYKGLNGRDKWRDLSKGAFGRKLGENANRVIEIHIVSSEY